jgi:DNA-binding response OmpR family regulator
VEDATAGSGADSLRGRVANILIIDDDRAVSTAIKLVLERNDHNVVVADDGLKGLELFEATPFDLLIVDIFMPGMDGFETMNLARRKRPETPIIVISGHMFRSDEGEVPDFLRMATRLGAVKSLQKPFRPRELLAAIAECLTQAQQDAARRSLPSG